MADKKIGVTESQPINDQSKHHGPSTPVKYGELVILGYNGCLPNGDRGRRRSKFILYKRLTPNGVKPAKHYVVKTPHSSQAVLDTEQHSISYTLSRNQAVIVEYTHDDSSDMFQIGRSSEAPIDFIVLDTVSSAAPAAGHASEKTTSNDNNGKSAGALASTISRFACRILCDRSNPSVARIYAAGFDSSKNIFLGEKATKWQCGREIDGLTTNGVLMMHAGSPAAGQWCEVSVGGGIYSLRVSRSAQSKGTAVEGVTNILRDGTLIDLCGATLLWRTADGLTKSPTMKLLEQLVDRLNSKRPVCPVGLNTLVIARHRSSLDDSVAAATAAVSAAYDEQQLNYQQPYVYLQCGHVQGHHSWGVDKQSSDFRTCPMCLKMGRVVKLCMGIEAAFYVDVNNNNDDDEMMTTSFFAFNPCGHMATEKTCRYWAQVRIPHGTNGFEAFCPFCAALLHGDPPFIRLIFN